MLELLEAKRLAEGLARRFAQERWFRGFSLRVVPNAKTGCSSDVAGARGTPRPPGSCPRDTNRPCHAAECNIDKVGVIIEIAVDPMCKNLASAKVPETVGNYVVRLTQEL